MESDLNNIDENTELSKTSREQISRRRNILSEYLKESLDNRLIPTDRECIAHMSKDYEGYSRGALYRDKLAIKAGSKFIHELSTYSYSAYIEDLFNKIELVESESMKDFEHSSGFVRINAKKLMLDCQKVKGDLLSGQVLNVSVEKLGKKLRETLEENKKLKEERILKSKS